MSADLGPDELDAFVDGELALTRHVEIEARVAADGALRARVDALRRLRESVRDHADYHAAPASLRAAITGSSVPTTPSKSAVDSRVGDAVRRWLAWRPLASALALVVLAAVGVNLVLSSRWHDERLRDEVVASHTRATLTQHLVDVASAAVAVAARLPVVPLPRLLRRLVAANPTPSRIRVRDGCQILP